MEENEKINPEDKFYSYAVRSMKKIAPYVFEGMIFGYNFDYTPYDKTRKVDEFFQVTSEFEKYGKIEDLSKLITYTEPYIENNILYCYAEIKLDNNLDKYVIKNQSIIFKKISGKGQGKLQDDTEGIKKAFEDAIKNSVRNYARTLTKNKPREITGKVIINRQPRIYIQQGQYNVDVQFLLDNLEIIEYKHF